MAAVQRVLINLFRPVLAMVSIAAALGLGFLAFTPAEAENLIHRYGYFVIGGTLVWFAATVGLAWREHRLMQLTQQPQPTPSGGRSAWYCGPWLWPAVTICTVTVLCWLAEPARPKVLYDEYVLQATAMQMHLTREVGTLVRAYDINGVFLPIDAYLDKRPYFFPFLLALVHDLTGYRTGNAFLLNALLTPCLLILLFLLASRLTSRRGGILAVLLLGPLPLLAQNSNGSGMELLNLTMLLLTMWLGTLAAERPTSLRLSAFVLAAVLLAQSRYESVLYAGTTGLVLAVIWWRERRILLPWPVIAAPLLLIPTALHQLVLSHNQALWELPKNLDSRFSWEHVTGNTGRALNFFFNSGRDIPNSLYLSLLGLTGLLAVSALALARPSRLALNPVRWVIAFFSLGVATNLGLLMFYFWGGLDDPLVSRLALPGLALLALLGATGAHFFDRFVGATQFAIVGALVAVGVVYGRATPLHLYSSQNLVAAEVEWEREWVARQPAANRLIITNKSSLPWLVDRTSSMLLDHIRRRETQLRFHLQEGTFGEVLVMQRLRPTTVQGALQIAPEDVLSTNFVLEPLTERRFGMNLARISRLVAVAAPSSPALP